MALAVVAVVIGNHAGFLSVDAVSDSLTEAVTSNSHSLRSVIGLVKRFGWNIWLELNSSVAGCLIPSALDDGSLVFKSST